LWQPNRRYFEATMARFTRLRATLRFYLEGGMKRQPPGKNDASLFAFFECRFSPETEYNWLTGLPHVIFVGTQQVSPQH
jgi:hypothetical protein